MLVNSRRLEIKQLTKVALKALQTNKSRSFLTALGVIIGVASVILLVSVGSGLKTYITGQMQDMGSNLIMIVPGDIDLDKMSAGSGQMQTADLAVMTSKLKLEHMEEIKKEIPEIQGAIAIVMVSSPVNYKRESKIIQVIGTTEDYIEIRKTEFYQGAFFSKAAVNSGRKVAVLGFKIAEDLFGEKNPLGKKIELGEARYTVIGVIEKKGGQGSMSPDDKIFIPLTTAQHQFDQDNVNLIMAEVHSSDEISSTISQIEQVLKKRLGEKEFSLLDQKEILSTVSNILNTLTAALGGIAAISLLVGGIGIMNIMLVSVTERTHEIGLRKALGATPEIILTQFLLEAVFLSVGGGIVGIVLGCGGTVLLNKFMPSVIAPWSVLLAFFVSAAVGIVFGIMPARRAAKLSPIEALRYE